MKAGYVKLLLLLRSVFPPFKAWMRSVYVLHEDGRREQYASLDIDLQLDLLPAFAKTRLDKVSKETHNRLAPPRQTSRCLMNPRLTIMLKLKKLGWPQFTLSWRSFSFSLCLFPPCLRASVQICNHFCLRSSLDISLFWQYLYIHILLSTRQHYRRPGYQGRRATRFLMIRNGNLILFLKRREVSLIRRVKVLSSAAIRGQGCKNREKWTTLLEGLA